MSRATLLASILQALKPTISRHFKEDKSVTELFQRALVLIPQNEKLSTSYWEAGIKEGGALVRSARSMAASNPDQSWMIELSETLYSLESVLGGKAREETRRKIYGLYFIIDPQAVNGRDPFQVAKAALEGGVRILQLRDKVHDKGESLPLARQLVELCNQYNAMFIVNDHADLASCVQAHGLHLGQTDLPIWEARHVLEPWQLVGKSNALLEEALASEKDDADYIAVGSIFLSTSKEKTRPAGLETLQKVKRAVSRPVVAIGGIKEDNVSEVVRAGADVICVMSAIGLAPNPKAAAERLVARVRNAGGRA